MSAVLPLADDPFGPRLAVGAPGSLALFNAAGVLAPADVHVATRLADLAGEGDEAVLLAAAMAVRGPRLGHVCADLATLAGTVIVEGEEEVDLGALPWPEPSAWRERVAASDLVAVGEVGGADRPLRLLGSRLYLDRYWREERAVAADLRRRAEAEVRGGDSASLPGLLTRLFPEPASHLQRVAGASVARHRLTVIAGGPGTGKTTTVARVLALLEALAGDEGAPPPLFALAAPTGKAAARLEEAVREEVDRLELTDDVRARLTGLSASTLHRLLGARPDSRSRFRHNRANRLPHDVVIVDETSMVPLTLMARLLEAVREGARLVLVGDPQQLASVEAGAVLGDVVGPAADGMRMRAPARAALSAASGREVRASDPPAGAALGDGVVVLRRVHRYGEGIAALADAVRAGDADAAMAALDAPGDAARWIDAGAHGGLAPVRQLLVDAGGRVREAALEGDGEAAIAGLGAFRLLCAHRRGPDGVAAWTARAESWLAAAIPGYASEGQWYPGRPLLVTANDYGLRLFNGDTGVVVAGAGGRPVAAFERGGEVAEISPTRLDEVETVLAMTIHKSQGSQFDRVAVLLPDARSPLLTRELLYTAITRAKTSVLLVGAEEALRAAIGRPVARASGLRERLWGG